MRKFFAIIGKIPNSISSTISNNNDVYIDEKESVFIEVDKTFNLIKDEEKFIAIDGDMEVNNLQDFVPEKITTPFVCIIYDKKNKIIHIISDKYGIKPFYYTQLKNEFIFSSDIKSIIKHPNFTKKLNYNGLLDYILFNFTLEDETFLKGIKRLPAASIWSIDIKTRNIKKNSYFDIINHPISTSINDFGKVFYKIIKNLIKENSYYVTLTGGYDTRAILATLLNQVEREKINLITFGEKNSIEAIIASKIAKITKCNHIIQKFIPPTLESLSDYIYLSDGLCQVAHSYLFSTFKKYKIEPCIMGYGGSEIIRGLHEIGLSVSRYAKNLILSDNFIEDNNTLFLFNLKDLKDRFYFHMEKYSKLNKEERHFYFILEVIRKYYAPLIKLLNSQTKIITPFINSEFIYYIGPLVKKIPPFSNNPIKRILGQKIAASIIKYNYPKLLFIHTDRGYPPLYNLHNIYFPKLIFHQIIRRRKSSYEIPSHEYVVRENVKKIFSEKMLSCEYLQNKKISEIIKKSPTWDIPLWIELSKVATFELFLRTFNL